ncbi:GspMb/PilO family protein [Pontiella sp.]|uniref:GspMb/PilO family protein n=1 Tax=Pontiella sp. TaxID=2837462 RepID=UPI003566777C
MKKPTFKISRREKIYLVIGGVALLIGGGIYPALRAATAFRQGQLESLQDEIALLEDLNAVVANARAIQQENEMLRDELRGAGELLFPPMENRIMMQSKMTKLLNEMGPDLDLEVSAGRSTIGDSTTQMNLSVRGRGRYPELLKFLHRLETSRPLILVDSMSLNAPRPKKPNNSKTSTSGNSKKAPEKTKDPSMQFRLSIQIHMQAGEEGGA